MKLYSFPVTDLYCACTHSLETGMVYIFLRNEKDVSYRTRVPRVVRVPTRFSSLSSEDREPHRAPTFTSRSSRRPEVNQAPRTQANNKEQVRTDALRVPLNTKDHHPTTTVEPSLQKKNRPLKTCRSAILTSTKWQMNWPTKQPNWTRPDGPSRNATTTTPRC